MIRDLLLATVVAFVAVLLLRGDSFVLDELMHVPLAADAPAGGALLRPVALPLPSPTSPTLPDAGRDDWRQRNAGAVC